MCYFIIFLFKEYSCWPAPSSRDASSIKWHLQFPLLQSSCQLKNFVNPNKILFLVRTSSLFQSSEITTSQLSKTPKYNSIQSRNWFKFAKRSRKWKKTQELKSLNFYNYCIIMQYWWERKIISHKQSKWMNKLWRCFNQIFQSYLQKLYKCHKSVLNTMNFKSNFIKLSKIKWNAKNTAES